MLKTDVHMESRKEKRDNIFVMEDIRQQISQELPRVKPVSVADIEDPAERFVCESCQ